jgi:hypothetical protein
MTTQLQDERVGDTETAMRNMLQGLKSSLHTALPCIVETWDPVKNVITCQPAISSNVRQFNGTVTPQKLPLLLDVPVMFPGAGGFVLTHPISPGDECLVHFSERCFNAWWAQGGVQPQEEIRFHDLSDGFAFFAPKSVPKVWPSISTTTAQFRDQPGTTYFEVAPAGVLNLVAVATINLTAPNINLIASEMINLSGNTESEGTLTNNGVDISSTHAHSGVEPGGGDTGPPV